MRPYLALIKDSFRAAMASRVLYILLFLIAVLLLAIAPLHMRETLDWKLIFMENVKKPDEVARILVQNHEEKKPVGRIWELLPDDLKKSLTSFVPVDGDSDVTADDETDDESEESHDVKIEIGGPGRSGTRGGSGDEIMVYQMKLLPALNDVIQDPEFYRPQDWEGVSLSEEAKELIDLIEVDQTGEIDPSQLSEERMRRLNRILVSRALSPVIEEGDTALEFWYAIWKWDFLTTSLTHQQFAQILTTQLPYYFDKFVLSIGLFIAILVTANMIPETFEEGSLNLLLSKPISRWATYVAKFFGGCTFILLCSAFLFLGVWLWLGLAMEVWDRAMLFSIPLYVLVFAIYFSVSALVGLVWRSPILAVVLTLLFWIACFAVGSMHGVFATKMENSAFVELVPGKNEAYPVDLLQQVYDWDAGENIWDNQLEAELGEEATIQFGVNSWMIPMKNVPAIPGIDQRIKPVYHPEKNLIYASPFMAKFNADRKLMVADADEMEFEQYGKLPRDTQTLAITSNGLVAVTSDGRFHLLDEEQLDQLRAQTNKEKSDQDNDGDDQHADQTETEDSNPDESQSQPKETAPPAVTNVELFESIGPDRRVSVREANLVDFNPVTQQFAIYRRGKLTLFDRQDDGQYQRGQSLTPDVEFNRKMSCLITFKGDTIMLAFGNGKIIEYDANTLEKRTEHQPETRSAIESISASPDGKYVGAYYRNGNLWILDRTRSDEFTLASVNGQGSINAFAFGDQGKLWVAENTDRLTMYNLAADTSGNRLAPGGTWYEKAFRWAIAPMYRAFPKPGEFYKVVSHLSSAGDAETNLDVDLRINPLENANPWAPLWSGLGFMLGMLIIASTYFHFKDF